MTREQLTAGDPRHGTLNGHKNHGCRCTPCRDARAAYDRHLAARRATSTPPAEVHGTWAGYNRWKCLCDPCRAAGREYARTRDRTAAASTP